jgi:hypothetical protein
MAAVTENSRFEAVVGNLRQVLFNVDIAANGDTLDTKLHVIHGYQVLNDADDFTTATVSGGTLTFVSDAAEDGVQVAVWGH